MNNSRLDAGSINEFKPGKTKRVEVGNGKGILVCNVGGEFSVKTGEALAEPAEVALQTYPVNIEDGRIFITL